MCDRLRRLAALTLLGLLLPVIRLAGPAAAADTPTRPVILIGVPGLQWSDLSADATPTLWRLAGRGAIGSLSVRTVKPQTCTIDGWLTVSAGERATLLHGSCGLPPTPIRRGGGAVVPDFARMRQENLATEYRARVGLLGDAVHRAGGCTVAVGPGGALAAADTGGHVDVYAPDPAALPADWSRCTLAVVDVDDIARTYVNAGVDVQGGQAPVSPARRAAAVKHADARVARMLAVVPRDATVLVAGVSDSSPTPHLHVAMATGRAPGGGTFGPAYLTAESTHRRGLVTLTDVTATVLRAAGVAVPSAAVGSPWQPAGTRPGGLASAVRELDRQDLAAQEIRRLVGPFFTALVVAQVVLYAVAGVALRRRFSPPERRRRVLRATRYIALFGAAMPAATFLANLVPWWRLGHPAATLVAAVVIAGLLVVAVAQAGPWRRALLGPVTVVTGLTALVLAVDVMTGSRLQMNSLNGYSPLVAGRFYGFGNIAFALWSTALLMFAAGLADRLLARGLRRRTVTAVVGLIGLAGVVINGWPDWGSDFGGVIALSAGAALLTVLVSGRRLSFGRLGLVVVSGAAAIAGIAYADYLRPVDQRTHLGKFVAQLLTGDATTILDRKFTSMVHSLGNVTLTLLVPLPLLFLVFVLLRPTVWQPSALRLAFRRAPLLRSGLLAVLATSLIGFAVNDSGVAIPALAFTLAVPLALAAAVRALEQAGPEATAQAAGADVAEATPAR